MRWHWDARPGKRLRRLDTSDHVRSRRAFTMIIERRRTRVVAALLGALSAMLVAGPVGGVITVVYTWLALDIAVQRRRDALERAGAGTSMDHLLALASDLRAGSDPAIVSASILPAMRESGSIGAHLATRVGVAMRVAEASGARLADLVDRLEGDTRAVARVRDQAYAQATGAQVTAWLLAALPLGGIAIGAGMGAHPVHELLHTPIGALCSSVAVTLQALGVLWTQWLAAGAVRAA